MVMNYSPLPVNITTSSARHAFIIHRQSDIFMDKSPFFVIPSYNVHMSI